MVAPGDKDFEERLDIIRFRLQGNTLRIVHEAKRMAVTGNHTTATVTVATGLMCWVKRPIANSLEETMKKVGDVQASLCCLACLLCHSPPHSSAPPTSAPNNLLPRRRGTGRPKKSFLPSPAAKPAGTVSTMQNISPRTRSRRSRS